MAKKVLLQDLNNVEILPITRGELVLDSSGKKAFHSSEFLATTSLPGLMSAEDKHKLDNYAGDDTTYNLVSVTADGLAPKIGNSAELITTQEDEWVLTTTKGETPSWRKLPISAFSNAQVANSKDDDGYVLKGSGQANKVWQTDPDGNPAWRDASLHKHTTEDIALLTGYTKGTEAADLAATDTLNVALGKLEYKTDIAYNLIQGAYDGDGIIENLNEILKVLEGISDTEPIKDIIGKYLPLIGGELSGNLSIGTNATELQLLLSVSRNNEKLSMLISGDKEGWLLTNYESGKSTALIQNELSGILYKDTLDNYHNIIHSGNISSYALTSLPDHSHPYLPTAGGTMTGPITMNVGTGIQMKYDRATDGNPWMYANGADAYGIRYFEGDPDKMVFSASGNAKTPASADLCINGNGEGTVTIRGNNICHAGNIGSQHVNTANKISHSTYYYDGNVMTNTTTSETIFGDNAQANYLFPSFMQSHPVWNGWADVINFTGYCMWGGTQFATEYNAINPRVAIRKYNQSRSNWGDWTEFITSGNLTYQVGDWNSAVLSVFKSSENKINNAPTQDFCYGVHLRFHRDTANYFTDLVTTLYSDNLYYRRHTENGYSSWKRLAFTSDIPTVTNYYWANVPISDTSSLTTSPTFANAKTTELLTVSTGASHYGIKVGNTYINSIDGDLIFQNNSAIRFGGDSWDYDVWAGLRYVSSAKTIHLGIADKSIFSGNNVLDGGTLNLPGIHHISSALYNIKVGSVASHTPSTTGWYTIAQVSGYFNYDIYITGEWANGMPSTVRVNICNINGTSKITQLAGYVGGLCSQIRLGRVSTDVWDVQVYIIAQPRTMGEQRCIFTGFGGLTIHHTSTLASTSYSATNTLAFGQISGISLTTDNYASYLGYIGTTAVQTSAATQALTGITRISNSANNILYLGNSDNSSWVYTLDICSHSGASKWAININGAAWFSKLMVGIAYSGTGSNYAVNVSGDSYTTGWSRSDSGFYVEGKGVHYMAGSASGIGQIYLINNEFNWGASNANLYFNHGAATNGTTVTSYTWNAGSPSSYASHRMGQLTTIVAAYPSLICVTDSGNECNIRFDIGTTIRGYVGYNTSQGAWVYNAACNKYLALNDFGIPHVSGKHLAICHSESFYTDITISDVTSTSMSDFITRLNYSGLFSNLFGMCRGSWYYAAGTQYDTGVGTLEMAGTAVLNMSASMTADEHDKTLLFIEGSTGNLYSYVKQSSGYDAVWSRYVKTTDKIANATSADNANTLDGINSTGFLQNYSQDYGSSISAAVDISPTLTAGIARVHISNVEYSSVLTGYDFNNKAWQLRFMPSYNDGVYFRSQGTGTTWKKLAFTSDIPAVSNSNGYVPRLVSFPSHTYFGSSTSTYDYLQNIVKWIYDNANYGDKTYLMGVGNPNSLGMMNIQLYGNSGKNSAGWPRYCSGTFLNLGESAFEIFGTNDYNYYYCRLSVDGHGHRITKLHRRDSSDDYSLQHHWTGSYWYLRGYYGDTYHAGVQVAYADSASTATEARTLCTDETMKLYATLSNEVNFGGTNEAGTIYFGYRATDSKPIPTSFVFGGPTGSATLTSSGFKKKGSSDSYVLLGGGSHKLESSLSVGYAELAGSATTAGTAYGLSKSFTVFGVSFNGAIDKTVDMSTLIGVMGTGDSDITDSTHILTSHISGFDSSGNTTTIYKRTANYLWNYIKGKIDATYTHGASGGYLPLTGGTMTGSLTFNLPSSNRRVGIIGTYDPDRAAAIWSMGDAYQISTNGLSFGGLYGAAYAYFGSGYTFGAKYSIGHSFVWCQAGTPSVALGDNIWTKGSLIADCDGYGTVKIYGTSGGSRMIEDLGTANGFYIKTNASWGMTIKVNTNEVVIGNNTKAMYTNQVLDLGTSTKSWGDLYAAGGKFYVTSDGAYHTSDIRKKTNITKARNLDISDLLVEFDWKESGKHSWGYIAQDLLEVLPEAVDYNEDIDVYSVNYNVAHSAAIASLTARIKELEEKLKKYGIW